MVIKLLTQHSNGYQGGEGGREVESEPHQVEDNKIVNKTQPQNIGMYKILREEDIH